MEFSPFHEERGAGKTDPQGGHILVNRKKIVNEKRSYSENKRYEMIVAGIWFDKLGKFLGRTC